MKHPFTCVRCRAPLADAGPDALRCTKCSFEYPVVDGAYPVLVTDPKNHLTTAYGQMQRELARMKSEAGALSGDIRLGLDPMGLLARMQSGILANHAVFKGLQSQLTRWIDLETYIELDAATLRNTGYSSSDHVFDYLRRDWSGAPESEEEIRVIEQTIERLMAEHCPDNELCLVLGAGMARVAWDQGRRFERVLAMDISLPMGSLFYALQRGPVRFFDVELKNARTAADQVAQIETITPPAKSGLVDYLIGSVTEIPLPDRSVSCALSIFFTDVRPFRNYARELLRVLKPGGIVIHFGPLLYNFDEPVRQFTADEFVKNLAALGLEVRSPSWTQLPHLAGRGRRKSTVHDNWSFAAVATGGEGLALTDDTVLSIEGTVVITTTSRLSNEGEQTLSVRLKTPHEEVLFGETTAFYLARIDGQRDIGSVLADVAEAAQTELSEEDRAHILGEMRKLVDLNVLSIARPGGRS